MMRYTSIFLFLLAVNLGFSQSDYKSITLPYSGIEPGMMIIHEKTAEIRFKAITIPFETYAPFLAINLEWVCAKPYEPEHVTFYLRFGTESKGWGDWILTTPDPHTGNGLTRFFTNQIYEEQVHQKMQVRMDINTDIEPIALAYIRVHLYNPGPSAEKNKSGIPIDLRSSPCSCMVPPMQSRAQWCPDGSCLPHPNPESTIPTHLIIHHSAGANVSSDWPAIVRSIWNYHVNSNGWSDIGYNWLVDPLGNIYVGRGDQILGAHFCGKNGQTLGICMLGDFTTVTPSIEALSNLEELLAWKSCAEGIHPLEEAYHVSSASILQRISGHRDACNTSCPGNALYPILPQIRQAVLDELRQSCICALSTPVLVRANAQPGSIFLEWTYSQDTNILFFVERQGPSESDFQIIDSTEAKYYTDQDIMSGSQYTYRVRATNTWCSSVVSNGLSTNTFPDSEFLVTPTLVQQEVTLSVKNNRPEPVSISIYSIDGRLVWQREYSKPGVVLSILLDIHTFPAGSYVLQMTQGNEKQTRRIIKI